MAERSVGAAAVGVGRALLIAVVVGVVMAVVVKAVLWLFKTVIRLLWEELPEALDVDPQSFAYLAIVLGVGGLLVGLGNRYLGYHPKPLDVVTDDVKDGKGVDYRTIPQTLLNSVAALGFGGPLGPEAALVAVIGGLFYWAKERMETAALEAYRTISGQGEDATPIAWRYAPAILSVVVVVVVFRALPGGVDLSFVPGHDNPGASSALLWAIGAGAVGGVLGLVSHHVEGRVRSLGLFNRAPIITAIAGGLIVAALAVPSFLVLFSGAENMGALFDGSTDTPEMVYAAVAKWLGLMVVLALGWKGGPIFPLMFISGALAIAAGDAFGIDGLVLYAGGIAGAVTGGLRSIVLGILVALLVVPSTMLILVVVGAGAAGLVARLDTRRTPESA